MPAFIKTPADEKRWAKAKEAANKTHSESEGDSYWAIVNSIYQKMTKSDDLERLENILTKARKRLSDEAADPDDEEESLEDQGFREFDPDEGGDDADKWLEANDPKKQDDEEEGDDEPNTYEEYGPDEDEENHQRGPEVAEEEVPEEAVGAEGDKPEGVAEENRPK